MYKNVGMYARPAHSRPNLEPDFGDWEEKKSEERSLHTDNKMLYYISCNIKKDFEYLLHNLEYHILHEHHKMHLLNIK